MTDHNSSAPEFRNLTLPSETPVDAVLPSADDPAKDGDGDAAPATPKKRPSMIREVIETLILALVIFVLVRAVVLNFKVDGHSMDSSFDNGEMLLVNRNAYFHLGKSWLTDWIPGVHGDFYIFNPPKRGDVIVFNPPAAVGSDKPFIKRIIGLPGDTVETRGGFVYVNGVKLDEPYIGGKVSKCNNNTVDCPPVTVPKGQIFVMGDNRTNSEDSRIFGTVEESRIIGKAWVTYWPRDDIGVVPHYTYDNVPRPETTPTPEATPAN
ncbi:MAG TPA: signal peptidase I [Thermomicrobiales bacterium]|nr:signal peptidase I [Thermomicrobiales bacterium]